MNALNNTGVIDSSTMAKDYLYSEVRYHREAIYQFEKKLTKSPKCVATLCDWIDSYHELALIYSQKGDVQNAQKCLLIPHQSMLYMAKEHNGDKDQEQIAIRAINVTLPPLMAFAKEHPPCENCMKQLQAQLAIIEKNNKADH